MRLVGGPLPNSGQIEMFHNGEWRALCASGWNDQAAAIACGQMGFLNVSTWFASPELTTVIPFGSAGTHRGVTCTGTEERLFDCDFDLDLSATSCSSGNARTILVCQGECIPCREPDTYRKLDIYEVSEAHRELDVHRELEAHKELEAHRKLDAHRELDVHRKLEHIES